jgi:ferredoxin, 2Fe-2S
MVKIIIENLGQKELAATASNKTALQHFHSHFVDWMHSCGGKGRCTTCKMIVVKGMDQLGPQTAAEKDYLRQGLLDANERLACQAKVLGDIRVRVPDDSKLPHVRYSE